MSKMERSGKPGEGDDQRDLSWAQQVAEGWRESKVNLDAVKAERQNAKLAFEVFKLIKDPPQGEAASPEITSNVNEALSHAIFDITMATSEIDGYLVGGTPEKSRVLLCDERSAQIQVVSDRADRRQSIHFTTRNGLVDVEGRVAGEVKLSHTDQGRMATKDYFLIFTPEEKLEVHALTHEGNAHDADPQQYYHYVSSEEAAALTGFITTPDLFVQL